LKDQVSHEFRMDGEIAAVYREFNEYLQRNRPRIKADLERFESRAAQSHLLYAGRPLAVGFYPVILSKVQSLRISAVVESMMRLMEKATRLFLEEPAIRQVFGFGPEQAELIRIDPGYENVIPCARFDSFFDGQTLRFTEVNTDGTAGMDGAEKIAKLFLAAPTMREFFSGRPVGVFDINHCVLQTLLDCYEQFAGGKAAPTPQIAIVDWKEARTCEEFVAFEEFCREQGFEAVVADPRELEYDGRSLSHRGRRIDIIYRRVVSTEYIERLEEVEAMTRAFKERKVCVVGSFRSDVAFNKKIFAVVQDSRFAGFFTEDERMLVERHVPWTRPFEDSECEYRGRKTDMIKLARRQKDRFVLKPSNLYEGRGVYLGLQKTPSEWEETFAGALKGDYVLQEFIQEPSMTIGTWKDDLEMEQRFIHLGEFVFGGKFSGYYCRAAEGPLIDRTSREQLVPCIILGS